ncbi:MAG: SDR family oxidoreductase [Bacteroidetes bacterium]|nr:SDR family oxidoreductase [Bacteroidota bacterium]MDA0859516.1 SDR family oxidoreductase [Bacteroidota bacterium]MDA1317898.1 SDR family oxidoreductase [Bacteroidota bacterium]
MSKTVLITGGSSGIGKSIGEYLTQKGYLVYGTSRFPEKYKNSKFPIIKLDVTNPDYILDCVKELLDKVTKIDVLINNAGVGITGPMEEIPMSEMKTNFETNLFGPIGMINAVLPSMRSQQSGLIINITSIAGYMGLPFRGVYSASKGAFELITEAYRIELKTFGVCMTNVAPGDFSTNIAAGRYHAPLLENSPYKETYGTTLELLNAHVDDGEDPKILAKVVHKIIETKHPKIHYKVGAFLQKFPIVLKRILPDKAFERLLMSFYKL